MVGSFDHDEDTGFYRDGGEFLEPIFHYKIFNMCSATKTKLLYSSFRIWILLRKYSLLFKIKYLGSVHKFKHTACLVEWFSHYSRVIQVVQLYCMFKVFSIS